MKSAIYGEKLIAEYKRGAYTFELVDCPEILWCGVLGYAPNLTDEPDIDGLLARYQKLCDIEKNGRRMEDWSGCISINYMRSDLPCGMMFMQQVDTDVQSDEYDLYKTPATQYFRLACTPETARAAFDKDECGVWELFGVIKDFMSEVGYEFNDFAGEIEMYGPDSAYAYVPCRRIK